MGFKKYSKMINHYHNKSIQEHIEYNSSCRNATYIYQIKYDGSNISFLFSPGEEMKIGKRSNLIGKYNNFYGILDILDNYQKIINYFQNYVDDNNVEIQLYGEIYGKDIQNRIRYGDGESKYIKFFDIRLNGYLLTYQEIINKFDSLILEYWVETYGEFSYDEIFNLQPPEDHEGIVVKQYNRIDPTDRLLTFKIKNPKFEEKMKPKKPKKKKEIDPEVERLKELFLPYINENRILSVFSKEGEIQKPEQIGQYIKLVMEDAKEDFELENDLSNTDRGKMNDVFKTANREVVEILKKYL